MTDEQKNESVPDGKEADKPLEKDGEPISDYDKALALVKRREEATKGENEVLDRKEKLAANSMLGGTSGGAVEPKPEEKVSDTEYADKFMKGEVNPMKEDDISIN